MCATHWMLLYINVCAYNSISRPSAVSSPPSSIHLCRPWMMSPSISRPVSRPFLCVSGSSPTFQNNLIRLFCFSFPTPNSAEIQQQQQQQLQQQQLCVWHNGVTPRVEREKKRDSGKGLRANCRRLIKYFRDTRDTRNCCRHSPASFCLADFYISTTNFPAFGWTTTCSPVGNAIKTRHNRLTKETSITLLLDPASQNKRRQWRRLPVGCVCVCVERRLRRRRRNWFPMSLSRRLPERPYRSRRCGTAGNHCNKELRDNTRKKKKGEENPNYRKISRPWYNIYTSEWNHVVGCCCCCVSTCWIAANSI